MKPEVRLKRAVYVYHLEIVNSQENRTETTPYASDVVYRTVLCGPITHGDFRRPNPWSYSISERRTATGYCSKSRWGEHGPGSYSLQKFDGDFAGGFAAFGFTFTDAKASVSQDVISSAHNKALEKLYTFLRSSNLAGLVSLGESAELAHLHRQLGKSTSEMVGLFRTFTPSYIRSALKAGANLKLLYQFGIMPVINDVNAIKNFAYDHALRREIRVRSSATDYVVGDFIPSEPPQKGAFRRDESCRVAYGGFATVDNIELFLAWRLGLANPVSSAYQLVPFSFVVDWFFNVGQMIRNTENAWLSGLSYSDFYLTETTRGYEFRQMRDYQETTDYSGVRQILDGLCTSEDTIRTLNRSVLAVPPLPRSPSLKLDLKSGQVLSLAALLVSFVL